MLIKILNQFPEWNAIVAGNEPREKYSFKHERLIFTGWIPQDEVLSLLLNKERIDFNGLAQFKSYGDHFIDFFQEVLSRIDGMFSFNKS